VRMDIVLSSYDLLTIIFSYLSGRELVSLTPVCKKWNDTLRNDKIWTCALLADYSCGVWPSILQYLSPNSKSLPLYKGLYLHNFDEYVSFVRATTKCPTVSQTGNFAQHTSCCHSWYKHLSVNRETGFIFFLDPNVCRNLKDNGEWEDLFEPSHYYTASTHTYHTQFGCWRYDRALTTHTYEVTKSRAFKMSKTDYKKHYSAKNTAAEVGETCYDISLPVFWPAIAEVGLNACVHPHPNTWIMKRSFCKQSSSNEDFEFLIPEGSVLDKRLAQAFIDCYKSGGEKKRKGAMRINTKREKQTN